MVKTNKRDLKSPKRVGGGTGATNSVTLKKAAAATATTTTRSQTTALAANIKVVVRVRPPNSKEQNDNQRVVISVIDKQKLIFDPKEHHGGFFYHGVQQSGRDLQKRANKNLQFLFDDIFDYESTNDFVFENTTKSLIASLMDGYNCSVFAYGATGSGKTHTMLGNCNNPGITYLTMSELFLKKEQLAAERNFKLAITYLEVYNENVQDLLNPGSTLQLREDGIYGVIVAGLKMHQIDQPNDLFTLLEKGNSNRTQHPTDANAESSRSHAVFQVYIQMENKTTKQVRTAKLSMIDLAGSERGAATGFVGARFTEGANINKSLLALGNCINSLADGHRHVPYRDSKLTRLLKDSLGGNCQTIMIANVSPSSLTYEDTYNTLKYAMRAKKIKSNMKQNNVAKQLHANQYIKIVEDLNLEIDRLKKELNDCVTTGTSRLGQSVEQEEEKVDVNLSKELIQLFNKRKELLERMYAIECSEQIVDLRRKLKEDANSRLSSLCVDTMDKEEGHRRLGNTVDRCRRQIDVLRDELNNMTKQKLILENEMEELVTKNRILKPSFDLYIKQLTEIENKQKLELSNKKFILLEEELKSRTNLLEKMSNVLQPCYLQLRGHGFATTGLLKNYQELVRLLQGSRNITWDDDGGDINDVQYNNETFVVPVAVNDIPPPPPSTELDVETERNTNLNSTFVKDSPVKSSSKMCGASLMPRVYGRRHTPKKMTQRRVAFGERDNKAPRSPLTPTQASVKERPMHPSRMMKKKPPFRT